MLFVIYSLWTTDLETNYLEPHVSSCQNFIVLPQKCWIFKSKLGQAADMKQTIGCSKTCEFIKANKINI